MWIVWVRVPSDDRFITHMGLTVEPTATGEQVIRQVAGMWGLDEKGSYRLVRLRPDGSEDISPGQTLLESGVRDGDPLDLLVP
ncbi:hypothetical protein CVV65_10605 [Kyrpidia spormannii]|uniref:Ubiquitin-like domain-containing protein n=1 Tax=Kyrpidia spormannii TaxID=2055160 RepID=A0A2K8N923_9BACL|nr:hypothetical protein [Kyrpidia spormannii]ATY85317.1 hypothetical protein CVV65_10605 [Kyrpidia spormannii]